MTSTSPRCSVTSAQINEYQPITRYVPSAAWPTKRCGQLSQRFRKLYASTGRPSIAPERLLRALLLQALYSIRSERMVMEQLDYNLLFRWFVGLNIDFAEARGTRVGQCGRLKHWLA